MPAIAADLPANSCYLLFSETGTEEDQWLGPDLSLPRAHVREAGAAGVLPATPPSGDPALFGGGGQRLCSGGSWPMRLEERAHVPQRELDLLWVRLPRIDADLRIGREMRAFQRDGVGVRRHVVWQYENRRPAVAHEVACYGKHEVGVAAVHLVEKAAGDVHCDVGAAFDQCGRPALDVVLVEQVGHRRAEAARLRQYGGDDAAGGPLQQVPDEGAADAEAQHHELPDAEVIHQTDMIVGIGVPRPVDLEGAGGLAAIGVAQI